MSTCHRCTILRTFRLRQFVTQPSYRKQLFPRTLWFQPAPVSRGFNPARCISKSHHRYFSAVPESPELCDISTSEPKPEFPEPKQYALPICCPGCGAYSQTVDPDQPGYYGKTRKQTRKRFAEINRALGVKGEGQENAADLRTKGENAARDIEDLMTEEEDKPPKPKRKVSLQNAGAAAAKYLVESTPPVQICDRCHDLKHHNKAVPAPTPSLYSIRALIEESPYEENHVYHIVDAADFPMSLIQGIHEGLELLPPRSRNRRAKSEKYKRGKKMTDITFIITRSDLLSSVQEKVDKRMEYMRSVLRDFLRQSPDDDIRVGNLHMISCFRGWRTKEVREIIAKQRGGIWIVGKTNVGKSQFIESCFPKDSKNYKKIAELVQHRRKDSEAPTQQNDVAIDPEGLLPPAPQEDLYPVLPVVSSLPGTTVSPIRIPFGRGRAELIDLPGLHRDGFEDYVVDAHKGDLTMTSYVRNPVRHVIRSGQSLLLGGGLVRVTPTEPDQVLIAACFVPLEAHVTKTEKAIKMQTQEAPYPNTQIMKEGVGRTVTSAGIFDMKWDRTLANLPTHLKRAVEERDVPIHDLPYRTFGADLLVEGCGWVELHMDVRNKHIKDENYAPQVEVFTPNGRHVGWRQSIVAYSWIDERKRKAKRRSPSRGRQSIGMKKRQYGGVATE